ncbi:MAG: hypothetical protein ACSHX9_01570 [Luteolibacter sp.]
MNDFKATRNTVVLILSTLLGTNITFQQGASSPLVSSPEETVAHPDRDIIGHNSAKRMLAIACYDHHLQCSATDFNGPEKTRDPSRRVLESLIEARRKASSYATPRRDENELIEF